MAPQTGKARGSGKVRRGGLLTTPETKEVGMLRMLRLRKSAGCEFRRTRGRECVQVSGVAAADPHQPWEAGGDRWEGYGGRRMGVELQPCDRP